MATNQHLPATDSADVLHKLVGDDATAAFESDPKFLDSNPTSTGSSENLQTRPDREDVRSQPDLNLAAKEEDDAEDEDEDDEDEEDDDDLDDEDEDEDDEDDEDEDELEDDDEDEDEDDEDEDE